MYKGKIEAMVTKFSEKFAIIVLKKHKKICRRGLTHLDATTIFKKSFRYIWLTLYVRQKCVLMDDLIFSNLKKYIYNLPSNFILRLSDHVTKQLWFELKKFKIFRKFHSVLFIASSHFFLLNFRHYEKATKF